MSAWLGVVDDNSLLCEYVVVESETEMSAKQKLKLYLSRRGMEVPDAFLGVIQVSTLAHI